MSTEPHLIALTDASLDDDALVARTRAALDAAPAGRVAVQLRCRSRPSRTLLALAERLHDVCVQTGAPFIVNDRIDVALALGVLRVHLGGRSVSVEDARRLLGEGAWISVAAHAPEDVAAAERAGANAVLLAPIFATPGKGPGLGADAIVHARALAPHLALYALGGIDEKNARACIEAGATGVAAIRAVYGAGGASRVRELLSRT